MIKWEDMERVWNGHVILGIFVMMFGIVLLELMLEWVLKLGFVADFECRSTQAEILFHGPALTDVYTKKHYDLEAVLSQLDSKEALEAFLLEYGAGLIEYLGDEIDRIESEIRHKNPNVKFIDLEVD